MKKKIENMYDKKLNREQSESYILTEEEVKDLNMKITPELLKECGAIEAKKFDRMLRNGELQQRSIGCSD